MSLPFVFARTRVSARSIIRRSLVLGLALVLLSPVLGPAPSQATSDSNQLDQTRKQLAAIQKKLAQSKGEAAKIQAQVSALDGQINALDRQVGVHTRAVPDLESAIRSYDATIPQPRAPY